MGLFGLGRKTAAHQSTDPKEREAAVRRMPVAEQGTLCEIALADDNAQVRIAAAAKIRDVDLLGHLAKHKDQAVAKVAKDRLASNLMDELRKRSLANGRELLNQVTEGSALVNLSLQAEQQDMRQAAFDRLCGLSSTTERMLVTVAIQEQSGGYGKAILDRVETRGLLKDLSKKAKDAGLRKAAADKLSAVEKAAKEPSREKKRKVLLKKLEALLERARVAAVSQDLDAAASELVLVERERDRLLQEDADSAAGEGIEEVLQGIAGARRSLESHQAEAAAALKAQAEHATAKRALLEECRALPEADEAAVEALRDRWQGIGEAGEADVGLRQAFQAELHRLAGDDAQLAEEPAAAPADAPAAEPITLEPEVQAKVDKILDEARSLIDGDGPARDRDFRFKELDKQLRQLAGHCGGQHPVRVAFTDAYVAFKDKRREQRAQAEQRKLQRLESMRALLVEAEGLAKLQPSEAELDGHLQKLQDLQKRWRDVGNVPAKELGDLRSSFRAACDAAYLPIRQRNEARDWERFAKIPKAEALIAEVKALICADSAPKPAQGEGEADAAEKKDSDEAAAATEAADAAPVADAAAATEASADTAAAEPESDAAAAAETTNADVAASPDAAATETAEAPAAASDGLDPAARHKAVKELQQAWKKLGRLPRERNDELWGAFRAACDEVYEGLQDWFAERDKARESAQQKKEALISELDGLLSAGTIGIAGSIADRESSSDRADRVKEIQAEWKAAGPAPRAVDQELWDRYKALLDKHYAKKREQYAAQDQERTQNLHRKQAICISAEELADDAEGFKEGKKVGNKAEVDFLHEVKDLQREFRQIGHVPREHFQDIRERFKKACDRVYATLEDWFASQDEERVGNFEQKQGILKEIEELLQEERPDWFKDEARALQQKWREIGPVPRDKMEINDQFRAACDRIFNAEPGSVAQVSRESAPPEASASEEPSGDA